jgi:hypothetical protein
VSIGLSSLLSVVVQGQPVVVMKRSMMEDTTNGTTTTATNTKMNVCGQDNVLVTHTMDIGTTTTVRLEPKDNQIMYFQRHLPPQGRLDLSGIILRNNDDVISPQTVDSVVRKSLCTQSR